MKMSINSKLAALFAGFLFIGLTAAAEIDEPEATEMARAHALKEGVGKSAIEAGLKAALWKEDKKAVAICFKKKDSTLCLVLIRTGEKKFSLIDVSRVEGMNLAKVGEDKYTRVLTFPEKWRGPEDGWWSTDKALCQILFTTRSWVGKQRYTTAEPLVIREDLTPWWR